MSDLRDQIAALSAITTNLDAYLERRAAELAQPLIEKANAEAAERVREAEFEVTRYLDLVAEQRRHIERAERRIDRQVRRGDRLTDQIRTIRTLQAMWAKLGVHGMPVEREVFAQVARDLGTTLAQPDDQPKGT